ncbi:TNF receptor-associated factor family protein DDB_G0272098-like [Hylaeus anthracinus]|uniref:TNF receptor-associated factor family protein DDB_G0272098-like n=1 Tax=Hylaeus anthracinus TaxID=313031 RepID=UPI0023B97EDA|nr:TNF receptor-associated factor family protein DDB_G0272098-like [Hylaeus anthracinus]
MSILELTASRRQHAGPIRSLRYPIAISTALLIIVAISGCFADEEEQSPRATQFIPYLHGLNVPEDDTGYEQCRSTNMWRSLLGRVNVFAFLDPSWHYSYRQAIMLEMLKKRLDRSNFTDILFFVVSPPTNLPEDSSEIKAWKDISKSDVTKSESFWGAEETHFDDFAKSSENSSKMIFLQDTFELGIWQNFHAFKDEVAVIDRCGRLTYQVIIPWSILYFPYVKAAILSTYKEEPCGPCNEKPSSVHNSLDYEKYLFRNINPNEEETNQNFDTYYAKQEFDLEAESITMFAEDLNQTEDNENASTVISFDLYLNTNDITTSPIAITDSAGMSTERTNDDEDARSNDASAGNKSEPTTEVFSHQEETQTSSVISNLETTEDYNKIQGHSSSEKRIYDTVTDAARSYQVHQSVMDENLRNKKKEEIFSVDHKTLIPDVENKEIHDQKAEDLPLRIILYSPHLHQEDQTVKQYTHLVLKAGSPNYHEHFNSMSKNYNQRPAASETSDATVESKNLRTFISGVNESPGVYGEISDYWRFTEDDELNDRSNNIAFLEQDDTTAKNTENNNDNASDVESDTLKPSVVDADSDMSINNNADSDDVMQHKITEHYSKLVPWIIYILS